MCPEKGMVTTVLVLLLTTLLIATKAKTGSTYDCPVSAWRFAKVEVHCAMVLEALEIASVM